MIDGLRTTREGDFRRRLRSEYGPEAAEAIVSRLLRQGDMRRIGSGGSAFLATRGDVDRHASIAELAVMRAASWRGVVDEALLARTLVETGFRPDPMQLEAIRTIIVHPICIVHGEGGTGKTAIARVAARYLAVKDDPGKQVVAAFSARIATSTAAKCGLRGETLHALTGTVPGEEGGAGDPLDPGISTVHVDEAFSMGPGILLRLLRQASDACRIVLIGDPRQIPPIEGGRPVHDMLAAGLVPSIGLSTAHRLSGSGHLAAQARRVAAGLAPIAGPGLAIVTAASAGRESDVVKARRAVAIRRTAVAAGRSCLVMTPTRYGPAGHERISAIVAGRPRPGVGDAVITTAAHPRKLWRNGEQGTVVEAGGEVAVDFCDRSVRVTLPDPHLAFGYAMSAHRAQGLEYDESVIVLARSTAGGATRQLLTSAMTRAPSCTIITDPGLIATILARDEVAMRPGIILAAGS